MQIINTRGFGRKTGVLSGDIFHLFQKLEDCRAEVVALDRLFRFAGQKGIFIFGYLDFEGIDCFVTEPCQGKVDGLQGRKPVGLSAV